MHRQQAQISLTNDVEMTWRSADRVKGGVHVSKSPLLVVPKPQLLPQDRVKEGVHVS